MIIFKEKKTGIIYYANVKEHINFFRSNDRYEEIIKKNNKKVEVPKDKKTKVTSTSNIAEE